MASRDDNINSTIGEGSVFEGKYHIHGSLQIDGKFEGEIHTTDSLVVGESGRVKTNVFARRVIVGGLIIGNVEATEEVILRETGKVLGNITTPILTVYNGVISHGKVTITSNQGKDVEKLIKNIYESTPSLDQLAEEMNIELQAPKAIEGQPEKKQISSK